MNTCGKCCYGVMTGQNRMFCSAQNCFCEEVFYCEDYEPIVKPITNADRIRSMPDEELAEWIADDLIEPGYNSREQTVKMWLDWLREEATP